MHTYRLVYEATEFDPRRWLFLGVGFFFVFIGSCLLHFKGKPRVTWISNWPPHPVFAWFFFLFSVFWTTAVAISFLTGWLEVRDTMARKSYHVVEGPVTDFKALPKQDSFSVEKTHFSYSQYEVTAGFRKTKAEGGPIHANSAVRLGYICKPSEIDCSEPLIVRVEIIK